MQLPTYTDIHTRQKHKDIHRYQTNITMERVRFQEVKAFIASTQNVADVLATMTGGHAAADKAHADAKFLEDIIWDIEEKQLLAEVENVISDSKKIRRRRV